MRNLIIVLLVIFASSISAQDKGSISGTLLDKEAGDQPLPFANVIIKGTSMGTASDFDGLYTIENVPVGIHTLEVSFTGYETVTLPNIQVEKDKVTVMDASLGATAAALDEVVIKVQTNKEREEALILEQKNAVKIEQKIGAQELARKGVSDAEGAVTKIAGITKSEGVKNVFVRGLGDRLNATTLNGLPLPSEDPLYKNISLDFFSSDVIQNVGVNKTFGSSMYGDVAGATINIASKEHTGKEEFKIDVSTGINTVTYNKENFLTVDGATRLGTNIDNTIPTENFEVYNFDTSFKPRSQDLQTNSSISLSYGNTFRIKDNKLSTYFLASFDNDYSYRDGDIFRITTEKTKFSKDVRNESYNYNVKQILMGNLGYTFGELNNTIEYNGLVTHNNSQIVSEQFGVSGDEQGDNELIYIRRQQQNSNKLYVNQLLSEINLNERFYFDLGASYNIVRGDEPDRRIDSYTFDPDTEIYLFDPNGQANTQRFYGDLKEDEYAGKFSVNYKFGNFEDAERNFGDIKLGYDYRNTDRDFENITFGFVPLAVNQRTDIDPDNIDAILTQGAIRNGEFEFRTNRGRSNAISDFAPYTYNGNKEIHAGYIDVFYNISPSFVANIGLRAEKVDQSIIWDTNISSSDDPSNRGLGTIDENYLLPSLNLKYSVNDKNIVRLAASKTYTLPQFKELAPFKYEGVDFDDIGNPNMIPADNYNMDIKWERYFSSGELLTITGFYKHIKNPINRYEDTVGNLTFDNTGEKAEVYGIELEVRKKLYTFEGTDGENDISFGLNASFLETEQDLKESLSFTNASDGLEGASPFLVNTDITFNTKGKKLNTTSSLVFNYFSDRIFSLGVQGNQNTIESAIPTLDFIFKTEIGEKTTLKFGAKNLLNPTYKLTKETITGEEITVTSFEKGMNFSLGLSYKF
ncbi:TonB-dependent receptor [Aquimarina intermedia]|uniref:TonB-dependent receptor n=1 Tax=Aquimarina intermedia TaxID=350814 RepID=A0A5S5CCT0_9FLAO|nr:TonB-dependent receptor [Aquimarina intermedia]TYP77175.1 TonB-dependent receptor [Aquimarina intermedia]